MLYSTGLARRRDFGTAAARIGRAAEAIRLAFDAAATIPRRGSSAMWLGHIRACIRAYFDRSLDKSRDCFEMITPMPLTGSGSLESLRERNRRELVDALRRRGSASRADLARATGLSRSTVSTLVADLQAAGLVVEREPDERVAPEGPPADADHARPLGRPRARHRLRSRARPRRDRRPVADDPRRADARARRRHVGRSARSTSRSSSPTPSSPPPTSTATASSAPASASPARSTSRPAACTPARSCRAGPASARPTSSPRGSA